MELLLAGLLLLATAGAAAGAWRVGRQVDESGRLVVRSASRLSELQRIREAQAQLDDVQRFAEGTVEGGTRAVQLVHHGIAAIPFGILEAIPPTRPVTRIVHVTHDLIANSVYGSVSLANKGLGWLIRRRRGTPRGPD